MKIAITTALTSALFLAACSDKSETTKTETQVPATATVETETTVKEVEPAAGLTVDPAPVTVEIPKN